MSDVISRHAVTCVAALLLSALLFSPALAGDWPEADAFAKGTAHLLAPKGSQDVKAGVALITQAAEAGNPEAQYALALLYRQGGLIRKDAARSRALLERAAEKEIPEAQTVLGIDMLERLGEYDSPNEGRALLEKAAAKGQLRAHSYLGRNYLEKTLQYYDRALKHLTVAAEAGLVDAQLMLGIAYYNGGGLYRSNAPPQHKEGLKWIERAANGGSALAWTWIGWAYEDGKAVPRDLPRAAASWRRAAEMGDPPGAKALALAYRDGIGVAKDPQAYRHWLKRAADLGHRGAKEAVARQQLLAEKHEKQVLAALVLLGLVMGAGGGDSSGSSGPTFMDPSDPMQFWGMDIMLRIK
jgi:TPR repeat protein